MARFTLKHRLLVAAAWLVLTVAGAIATVGLDDRLAGQLAQPGQPAYETNQEILRTYGSGGDRVPLVPVLTAPAGRSFHEPALRQQLTKAFAAAAKASKGRAVSYADTGDDRLVSTDGRTTYGLVFVAGGGGMRGGQHAAGKVEAAMTKALPAGVTLGLTGVDTLTAESGGHSVSLLVEVVAGTLGALAVLGFVFGSLLAFVPLLVAAVSVLTSFGIVFALTEVTEVSAIVQFVVALVGLGIAIDYSLLLVTRWREERAAGYDADEAVVRAVGTAGRAVVLSGASVAIGMIALVVIPIPALRSVGWGGLIIPVVSVAVVLTLLPLLLATAGKRLDWPHLRKDDTAGRGWTSWARGVVRFRWLSVAGAGAVLVVLGIAAFGLQLGAPHTSSLASSGPSHDSLAQLSRSGVPTGVLTPTEVLVPDGTDPSSVRRTLQQVVGVHAVVSSAGHPQLLDVLPVHEGGSAEGKATVERVQAAAPPGVGVGGQTAQSLEFAETVNGNFPLVLALITVITFLVLARSWRSIVLPLKAVLLNLVSLGAIIGAMVLVWQKGYGSELIWNIPATGSISEFIPVLVFAFLYGLSMDYEVFILARIREEYDACGSTRQAVVQGIGRTGRLVTSAALILFLAFASLAAAPATEIKMFATGLGLGVLLDATLIRAFLVPALVALLGRANWWYPAWVARVLFTPRK